MNWINKLNTVLFLFVCLFLTRQTPLKNYSWIMNICLILLFVINFKDFLYKKKFIFNFLWSTLILTYSILKFNDIFLCFRFYLIVLLLNTVFFLKPNKNYIKIFNICIYLQIVFLIIFELYLIKNFDLKNYLHIRSYFIENGWGDVYTYNGIFWRIQILGNGLIPFSLFLSCFLLSDKKHFFKYLIIILNLFGVVIAGNFAYIVGSTYYFIGIFYYSKLKKWMKIFLVIFGIFFFFFPLRSYVLDQIQVKKESSNALKKDQARVLIENMSNPKDIILGKGLGNKIKISTKYRNYSDSIYYELQSLYFFNQLGILNALIFIFLHIILIQKYIKDKELIHIYISYLITGLFNPYILDTNHIVVIYILITLKNQKREDLNERKNLCYNSDL